ncbi:MAG: PGDYG domain-containing protein [Actinomycetota bacterium]|nr:PGDYG domain-containing protein [Actinomycetota bacterium]
MRPALYRKVPVVIEALRLDDESFGALEAAADWCGGCIHGDSIAITTLEGTMYANPGDWIIRDAAGEFYPCKNDIFEKTYEEVSA